MTNPNFEQVLAANIKYHEVLADSYDATQPHFLPENVERVDRILRRLREQSADQDPLLVDLGTGTGFIVNIAKRYFRRVVGVDATSAMLERVDRRGADIQLHVSRTESMPFLESNTVSVVTGYSFAHHLFELRPTLAEAYRVLRQGGHLYIDQDPNRSYWEFMNGLKDREDLPPLVRRERESIVSVVDELSHEFGLSAETVKLAEFQKVHGGGIDGLAFRSLLEDVGFRRVEVRYQWYLGEGSVRRTRGEQEQGAIGVYLRSLLPATCHLFKYIAFFAEK